MVNEKLVTKEDYYQMKRYLTVCDKKLGIIINFRQKYLTPKRVINSLFVDSDLIYSPFAVFV